MQKRSEGGGSSCANSLDAWVGRCRGDSFTMAMEGLGNRVHEEVGAGPDCVGWSCSRSGSHC